MFSIKRHPYVYLVAIVLLMMLPNLDVLPVTIMEARDYISAREMLTDNNWIFTTLNGEPRYQKPPLPTWLSAISASVFGINSVFGMRLPGVFMIALLSIFIFRMVFFLVQDRRQAIIAALISISAFYIIAITIEAPWDIYAHGFMLISLFYLLQYSQTAQKKTSHILWAGITLAASIMSKGPVSLFALYLPFLIAWFWVYPSVRNFKNVGNLFLILIIGLILGGWWWLYVRWSDPTEFDRIANVESSNWTSYNVKPWYYYWSFFTQIGIWTIPALVALIYPYVKKKVKHPRAYFFCWLWTITSVVLLSLIPEKKPRYLMPVLIPFVMTLSFYIQYLWTTFKFSKWRSVFFPIYFNYGVMALITLMVPFGAGYLIKCYQADHIFPILALAFVLFIIALVILRALRKRNFKRLFIATIVIWICLFWFGIPIIKNFENPEYTSLQNVHQKSIKTGFKNYNFEGASPEVIWDYGDKLPYIKRREKYTFPKETKFGMFAYGFTKEDSILLNNKYTMRYIKTFDLNKYSFGKNGRKDRLIIRYYTMQAK